MICPRCKAQKSVTNGMLQGIKRHRYKGCGFNFSVEPKSTAKSEKR